MTFSPLSQRELIGFELHKSVPLTPESLPLLSGPNFDLPSYYAAPDAPVRLDTPGTYAPGPRLGTLTFGDVVVETPVFMPVGTVGSVKALAPQDVWDIGYRLILGNTYHLNLRPGMEVMSHWGGLHNFMRWPGATLTDSGGFQVMSLGKIRTLNEEGVSFQNHINGGKIRLTPESAVEIQDTLDSDIQMVLDECTPYPADEATARKSMERSMRWAARARAARNKSNRAQFGIVQGGMHPQLRRESAQKLQEIGFEGYAVGGLSVGEPKPEMRRVLAATTPWLPVSSPRYLMGVGAPDDIIDAVLLGVDMFDCVMPTRNARNGSAFVRRTASATGKLAIKNQAHRFSMEPLDGQCTCYTCRNFSRGYLRHLFVAEELLVHRLMTIHNLQFLWDLTSDLRRALKATDPWGQILNVRNTYTGEPQPAAKG